MNEIEKKNKELLEEVEKLKRQVKTLKDRKKYGLVWEEEKEPEQIVLDCKYKIPILKEVKNKEILKDKNKPMNIFIEGDNYHALSVLNYTHREKIDVIYIDPPFNTGNKSWKYNNNYVDMDDAFRHSKWISFMHKRLVLAKKLLSEKGFLICAIDANELFSLGLLMDEIFGEHNRLGLVTVLHNPKGRNFTKWFSANSEYMLIYSKNVSVASFNDVAIDEEIKKTFNLVDENGKNYRLEPFMRSRTETLRENKPGFWYPIYVSKDFKHITLQHKKGYYKVYPIAQNGKEATWINLPDTFNEKNMEGTFVAKMENKKVVIYRKFYEQQIFKNVWIDKKYQSEFHGTNLLKEILGKNIFEYPKSLYLIEDILKITSKKDSIILDFFAGSGTTGHAVLKLNKEDKGNRKFILCTNNENKIAEEVCYPRIKKVIEGHKDHPEITKMQENLKYFKTELLDVDHISHVSDEQKIKLTYQAGEMIALRENTFDEVEKNEWWQIFKNGKKYMAIYFKEDKSRLNELVKRLGKLKERVALYIFSWGKNEYKNEFTEHKSIRVEDIPEPIIDVYKEINRLS